MNEIIDEIPEEPVIFYRSPAKHGPYFIFQIPNNLIKEGLIDTDGTFEIKVTPIGKTKEKK